MGVVWICYLKLIIDYSQHYAPKQHTNHIAVISQCTVNTMKKKLTPEEIKKRKQEADDLVYLAESPERENKDWRVN